MDPQAPATQAAPSFLHYVEHFIITLAPVALMFFVSSFPAIANLTIGALLGTGIDYLKHVLTA